VTILTLEPGRLAVAADASGAGAASSWLAQACADRGVPAEQVYRLDTCLTEALANVISHGGEDALAAPVVVTLFLGEAGNEFRAVLEIADRGRPFDPLAQQAAPQAATLEEATPGGLGLSMIRSFSDSQDYAWRDGQNRLTLGFCWPLFT
jgi:anti-sigma regulatory factor (Ser/Thr protein kinase)